MCDDAIAFEWTIRLGAAAVALVSLERLSLEATTGGLQSWRVLRLRFIDAPRILWLADAVLAGRRYSIGLVMGLIAAGVTLVTPVTSGAAIVPLAAIVLSLLMTVIRSPYGLDGADQMLIVIYVTALLASVAGNSRETRSIALVFIASQLLLSYIVAGFAKLRGATWRSGDALRFILATQTYGSPAARRALQRVPLLGKVGSRLIVVAECTVPLLVLAGNDAVAISTIVVMLLFHIATAIVMGLNNFVLAFASAYPALLYVRCLLRS